jgi:hypothetical protein
MNATRPFSVLILLAALVAPVATPPAYAQTPSLPACIYFSSAGHNVHGAFAQYYIARNGFKNFGNPLTEAFFENGGLVQYFRNVRLEYHPDYPEPFRVQVSLIGQEYGLSEPRLPPALIPAPDESRFLYFPATGLVVSFAIKKFYEANYGWELLGYPLTMVRNGGGFVQYFQRGYVEWSGADLTANSVRLGAIKPDWLNKHLPKDFKWRLPAPNDGCTDSAQFTPLASTSTTTPTPVPKGPLTLPPLPGPGTNMDVRVRVELKEMGASGVQFGEVTVDDQKGKPLQGIGLLAIVYSPNGERALPLVPTNADGISKFSFDIGKQSQAVIVVQVQAFWGGLTKNGSTIFTAGN